MVLPREKVPILISDVPLTIDSKPVLGLLGTDERLLAVLKDDGVGYYKSLAGHLERHQPGFVS